MSTKISQPRKEKVSEAMDAGSPAKRAKPTTAEYLENAAIIPVVPLKDSGAKCYDVITSDALMRAASLTRGWKASHMEVADFRHFRNIFSARILKKVCLLYHWPR